MHDVAGVVAAALLFAALAAAYVAVRVVVPWWRQVRADDREVDRAGAGVPPVDPDRVGEVLDRWRAEVYAQPIPELVDLDAAVRAVERGRAAPPSD